MAADSFHKLQTPSAKRWRGERPEGNYRADAPLLLLFRKKMKTRSRAEIDISSSAFEFHLLSIQWLSHPTTLRSCFSWDLHCSPLPWYTLLQRSSSQLLSSISSLVYISSSPITLTPGFSLLSSYVGFSHMLRTYSIFSHPSFLVFFAFFHSTSIKFRVRSHGTSRK